MQFLYFPALSHDLLKCIHVSGIHVLRLPGDAVLFYSQDRFL